MTTTEELEEIYWGDGEDRAKACMILHQITNEYKWIYRAWTLNPNSKTAELLIDCSKELKSKHEVISWMIANRPDSAIALHHLAFDNWKQSEKFANFYWRAMTTDSELSREYVKALWYTLLRETPNRFIPWGHFKPHKRIFWEYPSETRNEIRTWLRVATHLKLSKDIKLLICHYIGRKSTDFKCVFCKRDVDAEYSICDSERCIEKTREGCQWYLNTNCEGEMEDTQCRKLTVVESTHKYCDEHTKLHRSNVIERALQVFKMSDVMKRQDDSDSYGE